jgi:DNA processing protein
MTDEAVARSTVSREEVVALLALLRAAPRGVGWSDIAADVRFAGSAVQVFERTRDAQGTLFPDPVLEEALVGADEELSAWERANLDLVTVLSAEYPTRLAGVFDCPPFLFVRGEVVPEDRGMSVVGSRKASDEGLAMARCAAELLVQRGLTVIGGLAEGIDTSAHREALRIGGRTVAVIGTGIKRYFPASNHALQDEIAEKGLVISQFYPDQPPSKATFPMRNGTMSGYGMATIVVEAGEYSGSRIQARKAADHGHPVILFRKVVQATTWGAKMANNPWVTVVGTAGELADAIDQITANDRDDLVKSLGLLPA